MQFENPILLNLLWAIPLQILLLWIYWRWRQQKLRALGSPALAQKLLLGFSQPRFWLKNVLFACSTAAVVLALANPQKLVKSPPKQVQSADIILALDVSHSMLATDEKPNRLEKAKETIRNIMPALEGNRIGLIFFAGEAFAQMPLSDDYEALMLFVRNASPDIINDRGSDLASPMDLATRMFGNSKAGQALIMLSDGENHEDIPIPKIRAANEKGIVVHTISFGTNKGASILMETGGLKRDFGGKTVISKANQSLLGEIAASGGGIALEAGDNNLKNKVSEALQTLQKETFTANTTNEYQTYFQWLVGLALLLLIAEQILWWRKND
jgi:Ca-activated chloride channel homolog